MNEENTTTLQTNNKKSRYYRELTKELFPTERIWEIDFLRSLPIIIVVLYHACFDVYLLKTMLINYSAFSLAHPNFAQFTVFCEEMFFNPIILNYLVPLFGGIFLFICGVSTSLSKSNLKRALILDAFAIVFSIVTYVLSVLTKTDDFIYFGILHQMGFAITVYALIELIWRKFLKREPNKYVILAIGIAILVIGIVYSHGVMISSTLYKWPLKYVGYNFDKELKEDPFAYFKVFLGIKGSYNDWWPIFPYTGVIFIGMFLGKLLYSKNKKSLCPKLYCKALKPFCYIGSHTLYIYLLHQVILVILFVIIFICLGGKFF